MSLFFFRPRSPAPPPPEVYRQIWHKEPHFLGITDVSRAGARTYIKWRLPGYSKITHDTRRRFPWNGYRDFNDFKARQTGYKKNR